VNQILLRSEMSVFRTARSIIAESLWWDARDGLHWCDIDAGTLHTSALSGPADGRDDRVIRLPPPVSAFQPTGNGDGFVFAGRDHVSIASLDGTIIRRLASFNQLSDRVRFNEAKCDPFGRFVVGGMSLDNEPSTAIYAVDALGEVHTLIGGIGVSNGFEWSDDGRTMWFTDTASRSMYVAEYSEADELANIRPFADGRMSDGLTRDVDGGFWNGIYDTGTVVHRDSDGQIDLELDVPAGHVTSVALGGAELSTLFIATARENLTEAQLEAQTLTGSIFQVETETQGFPVRTFGTPQKGT
jgi:sugar lactone lactonase YvrE